MNGKSPASAPRRECSWCSRGTPSSHHSWATYLRIITCRQHHAARVGITCRQHHADSFSITCRQHHADSFSITCRQHHADRLGRTHPHDLITRPWGFYSRTHTHTITCTHTRARARAHTHVHGCGQVVCRQVAGADV